MRYKPFKKYPVEQLAHDAGLNRISSVFNFKSLLSISLVHYDENNDIEHNNHNDDDDKLIILVTMTTIIMILLW